VGSYVIDPPVCNGISVT